MRDDEVDPKAKHIVFLGDSTTFGLNINHEDTYPERYESICIEGGDKIQAVNYATPGQGTIDQLTVLKEIIKEFGF